MFCFIVRIVLNDSNYLIPSSTHSQMMLPQQTFKIFIYPCKLEENGGCLNTSTSYDFTLGSVYDGIYDQGPLPGNQTFTFQVPEINLNGSTPSQFSLYLNVSGRQCYYY